MRTFRNLRISCLAALVAALSLLAVTGPSVAQSTGSVQAGVAAAVRGNVRQVSFAAAPRPQDGEAVGRVVASGDRIYLNDRIETGPGAGLQIMLLDETIFTIGPNAAMEIDKFVYDPQSNAGEVTASIVKGAFRFVSGRIAKQNPTNMNVRLPVATIGIRGTSVAGEVIPATPTAPPNAEVILLGPGAENNADERAGRIIVGNAGTSVEISRPGYGTTISGTQNPPSPPVRVPPSRVASLAGNLAGSDDGNGDDGGDTGNDNAGNDGGSDQNSDTADDDGTSGDDSGDGGTQNADSSTSTGDGNGTGDQDSGGQSQQQAQGSGETSSPSGGGTTGIASGGADLPRITGPAAVRESGRFEGTVI